ncbi:hypothetical protein BBO99_00005776 [Phytophthora kernoviae]|uniref:Uncharacterized protein n=2 Tax=Phytophthora kernoviae TaxID=325452 RepID=A0A3R7JG65_9STRA|nr:hypothetical protein G195_006364 [Phytophthora kernoviae 00238/432]KAG2524978.1 hypothetical protein JM18_005093 [Phytophthora kernoviae]KAG2525029.1 hypothetical protein JM16_004742 [Phytophthora kernoviae]RLN45536.1 hypothetical protein BBI17_005788 [Phytophthora kernoviae]RLN78717.1 hypothetical protein BBO99_00005776 [Phytophthora kernoviae]
MNLRDQAKKLAALAIEETPGNHAELTRAYTVMIKLKHLTGDLKGAQDQFSNALEPVQWHLGPIHPLLCDTYMTMTEILDDLGENAQAVETLQNCVALVRDCFGKTSLLYADIRRQQGILMYAAKPEDDQAIIGVLEDAFFVYEKHFQDPVDDVPVYKDYAAECCYLLATLHTQISECQAMETAYSIALNGLSLRKEVLPPNHENIMKSFLQLGNLSRDLGEHYRAVDYYKPGLAILKNFRDDDHIDQLDPIEYTDQLIEKTELEFQDYRKQYNLNFAGTPIPVYYFPICTMAPVPAWTREWRPLVRQLCARIGSRKDPEDDVEVLNHQETLLLQADRVVGQLYSHRFVDSLPQDIRQQTEALATKFRVHSLEDRAQKLLDLSQQCDSQVLKLLLELARSPSKASDEQVAADEDSTSKWKKVLEEQQNKQIQEKQMQDRLVEELFEISTNDEWFQAWDESEDESDWEVSSADESGLDAEQSDGGRRRSAKRSSEVLEDVGREDGVMTSLDSRVSSVFATKEMEMVKMHETRQQETRALEFSQEVETRDEILRRYHPKIGVSEEDAGMMEIDEVKDPRKEEMLYRSGSFMSKQW